MLTAVFEVDCTADQYDGIIKDLEDAGLGAPDGRLSHCAQPTPEHWLVVDVWESEEKLGAFAERLMPIIAGNGVTPPTPAIYPTHNFNRG